MSAILPCRFSSLALAVTLLSFGMTPQPSNAVNIVPTFGPSITSQPNAPAIEADVNYATRVMDLLYTNSVTVPITFQFQSITGSAAAQSSTYLGTFSYNSYRSALTLDSSANPMNAPLATALGSFSQGNGADGSELMLLTHAEAEMLGQYGLSDPYSWGSNTITLNSNLNWTFAGPLSSCSGECRPLINSIPVQSGTYDANQALFHEMDEILGGGGQGSTLNDCLTFGQYCNTLGTLDLYRYVSPGVPSYSTSVSAQAYMSFDGGQTDAIGSGTDFLVPQSGDAADFNDFTIDCTSYAALIQGYSCAGTIPEAYNATSPEFAMMSAIGWDHTPCTGRDCPVMRSPGEDPISGVLPPSSSVPEPNALWLLATGMSLLAAMKGRRRSRNKLA